MGTLVYSQVKINKCTTKLENYQKPLGRHANSVKGGYSQTRKH